MRRMVMRTIVTSSRLKISEARDDVNGARRGPVPTCALCPRLAEFRQDNQAAHADWHNAPVPSFGPSDARLLIVGLAPGLRGANRTGRPFTGDYAGDLLYPTLLRFGFARGKYRASPDDSLHLVDCRITNAVRCVPPANKPIGAEINACRRFLKNEVAALPVQPKTNPSIILTLGGIAHASTLRSLDLKIKDHPFGHGLSYTIKTGQCLMSSYHCSRYNVNTGRLTSEMFKSVIENVRERLTSMGD